MSSTLRRMKDIGFGMPYNGLPWNDPILNDINPGPVEFDQSYPGGTNILSSMFSVNGNLNSFSYTGHNSSLKAYTKCPPLSAIINRKAQAHINGKTIITDLKGKEAKGSVVDQLKKLFLKPNPIQSWQSFEAQQKIYIQLFGFSICLPILPAGYEQFGPADATSWWNIPPYMVDVMETTKLFYQTNLEGIVQYIRLNYKGTQTDLPLNKLGIFRDFTPSFNTMILPDSRVSLNEKPINNIIAALESENEIISYAGSQGIISPDSGKGQFVSVPISEPQKETLQHAFKQQYGIRKGQFRYIISPAAIKWQSMGTDAKSLMLIEYIAENSKSLCDGWGYPPHLLGLIDPTFNNQNQAAKSLYQDTIIPESDSMYSEWNTFLRTDELKLIIKKDFSHLPILQEDKEMMGRAMLAMNQAMLIEFQNNLITANEWREANGRTNMGPSWDVYYTDWKAEGKAFASSAPTLNMNPAPAEIPAPGK